MRNALVKRHLIYQESSLAPKIIKILRVTKSYDINVTEKARSVYCPIYVAWLLNYKQK